MKNKLSFIRWRKLKNGDWRATIDCNKKTLKMIKEFALKDNTLTIEEVKYQSTNHYKESLESLLIGAFILKALKENLESI